MITMNGKHTLLFGILLYSYFMATQGLCVNPRCCVNPNDCIIKRLWSRRRPPILQIQGCPCNPQPLKVLPCSPGLWKSQGSATPVYDPKVSAGLNYEDAIPRNTVPALPPSRRFMTTDSNEIKSTQTPSLRQNFDISTNPNNNLIPKRNTYQSNDGTLPTNNYVSIDSTKNLPVFVPVSPTLVRTNNMFTKSKERKKYGQYLVKPFLSAANAFLKPKKKYVNKGISTAANVITNINSNKVNKPINDIDESVNTPKVFANSVEPSNDLESNLDKAALQPIVLGNIVDNCISNVKSYATSSVKDPENLNIENSNDVSNVYKPIDAITYYKTELIDDNKKEEGTMNNVDPNNLAVNSNSGSDTNLAVLGDYIQPKRPEPKDKMYACLAGYDGEIFDIIDDIKTTQGSEIEVHFYIFLKCKFNYLSSHLTDIKVLQEKLTKYHHYICLDKKYVESYDANKDCWYVNKLIILPSFQTDLNMLCSNLKVDEFTHICEAPNKNGFKPLVLKVKEKIDEKDSKEITNIIENEKLTEICLDDLKTKHENALTGIKLIPIRGDYVIPDSNCNSNTKDTNGEGNIEQDKLNHDSGTAIALSKNIVKSPLPPAKYEDHDRQYYVKNPLNYFNENNNDDDKQTQSLNVECWTNFSNQTEDTNSNSNEKFTVVIPNSYVKKKSNPFLGLNNFHNVENNQENDGSIVKWSNINNNDLPYSNGIPSFLAPKYFLPEKDKNTLYSNFQYVNSPIIPYSTWSNLNIFQPGTYDNNVQKYFTYNVNYETPHIPMPKADYVTVISNTEEDKLKDVQNTVKSNSQVNFYEVNGLNNVAPAIALSSPFVLHDPIESIDKSATTGLYETIPYFDSENVALSKSKLDYKLNPFVVSSSVNKGVLSHASSNLFTPKFEVKPSIKSAFTIWSPQLKDKTPSYNHFVNEISKYNNIVTHYTRNPTRNWTSMNLVTPVNVPIWHGIAKPNAAKPCYIDLNYEPENKLLNAPFGSTYGSISYTAPTLYEKTSNKLPVYNVFAKYNNLKNAKPDQFDLKADRIDNATPDYSTQIIYTDPKLFLGTNDRSIISSTYETLTPSFTLENAKPVQFDTTAFYADTNKAPPDYSAQITYTNPIPKILLGTNDNPQISSTYKTITPFNKLENSKPVQFDTTAIPSDKNNKEKPDYVTQITYKNPITNIEPPHSATFYTYAPDNKFENAKPVHFDTTAFFSDTNKALPDHSAQITYINPIPKILLGTDDNPQISSTYETITPFNKLENSKPVQFDTPTFSSDKKQKEKPDYVTQITYKNLITNIESPNPASFYTFAPDNKFENAKPVRFDTTELNSDTKNEVTFDYSAQINMVPITNVKTQNSATFETLTPSNKLENTKPIEFDTTTFYPDTINKVTPDYNAKITYTKPILKILLGANDNPQISSTYETFIPSNKLGNAKPVQFDTIEFCSDTKNNVIPQKSAHITYINPITNIEQPISPMFDNFAANNKLENAESVQLDTYSDTKSEVAPDYSAEINTVPITNAKTQTFTPTNKLENPKPVQFDTTALYSDTNKIPPDYSAQVTYTKPVSKILLGTNDNPQISSTYYETITPFNKLENAAPVQLDTTAFYTDKKNKEKPDYVTQITYKNPTTNIELPNHASFYTFAPDNKFENAKPVRFDTTELNSDTKNEVTFDYSAQINIVPITNVKPQISSTYETLTPNNKLDYAKPGQFDTTTLYSDSNKITPDYSTHITYNNPITNFKPQTSATFETLLRDNNLENAKLEHFDTTALDSERNNKETPNYVTQITYNNPSTNIEPSISATFDTFATDNKLENAKAGQFDTSKFFSDIVNNVNPGYSTQITYNNHIPTNFIKPQLGNNNIEYTDPKSEEIKKYKTFVNYVTPEPRIIPYDTIVEPALFENIIEEPERKLKPDTVAPIQFAAYIPVVTNRNEITIDNGMFSLPKVDVSNVIVEPKYIVNKAFNPLKPDNSYTVMQQKQINNVELHSVPHETASSNFDPYLPFSVPKLETGTIKPNAFSDVRCNINTANKMTPNLQLTTVKSNLSAQHEALVSYADNAPIQSKFKPLDVIYTKQIDIETPKSDFTKYVSRKTELFDYVTPSLKPNTYKPIISYVSPTFEPQPYYSIVSSYNKPSPIKMPIPSNLITTSYDVSVNAIAEDKAKYETLDSYLNPIKDKQDSEIAKKYLSINKIQSPVTYSQEPNLQFKDFGKPQALNTGPVKYIFDKDKLPGNVFMTKAAETENTSGTPIAYKSIEPNFPNNFKKQPFVIVWSNNPVLLNHANSETSEPLVINFNANTAPKIQEMYSTLVTPEYDIPSGTTVNRKATPSFKDNIILSYATPTLTTTTNYEPVIPLTPTNVFKYLNLKSKPKIFNATASYKEPEHSSVKDTAYVETENNQNTKQDAVYTNAMTTGLSKPRINPVNTIWSNNHATVIPNTSNIIPSSEYVTQDESLYAPSPITVIPLQDRYYNDVMYNAPEINRFTTKNEIPLSVQFSSSVHYYKGLDTEYIHTKPICTKTSDRPIYYTTTSNTDKYTTMSGNIPNNTPVLLTHKSYYEVINNQKLKNANKFYDIVEPNLFEYKTIKPTTNTFNTGKISKWSELVQPITKHVLNDNTKYYYSPLNAYYNPYMEHINYQSQTKPDDLKIQSNALLYQEPNTKYITWYNLPQNNVNYYSNTKINGVFNTPVYVTARENQKPVNYYEIISNLPLNKNIPYVNVLPYTHELNLPLMKNMNALNYELKPKSVYYETNAQTQIPMYTIKPRHKCLQPDFSAQAETEKPKRVNYISPNTNIETIVNDNEVTLTPAPKDSNIVNYIDSKTNCSPNQYIKLTEINANEHQPFDIQAKYELNDKIMSNIAETATKPIGDVEVSNIPELTPNPFHKISLYPNVCQDKFNVFAKFSTPVQEIISNEVNYTPKVLPIQRFKNVLPYLAPKQFSAPKSKYNTAVFEFDVDKDNLRKEILMPTAPPAEISLINKLNCKTLEPYSQIIDKIKPAFENVDKVTNEFEKSNMFDIVWTNKEPLPLQSDSNYIVPITNTPLSTIFQPYYKTKGSSYAIPTHTTNANLANISPITSTSIYDISSLQSLSESKPLFKINDEHNSANVSPTSETTIYKYAPTNEFTKILSPLVQVNTQKYVTNTEPDLNQLEKTFVTPISSQATNPIVFTNTKTLFNTTPVVKHINQIRKSEPVKVMEAEFEAAPKLDIKMDNPYQTYSNKDKTVNNMNSIEPQTPYEHVILLTKPYNINIPQTTPRWFNYYGSPQNGVGVVNSIKTNIVQPLPYQTPNFDVVISNTNPTQQVFKDNEINDLYGTVSPKNIFNEDNFEFANTEISYTPAQELKTASQTLTIEEPSIEVKLPDQIKKSNINYDLITSNVEKKKPAMYKLLIEPKPTDRSFVSYIKPKKQDFITVMSNLPTTDTNSAQKFTKDINKIVQPYSKPFYESFSNIEPIEYLQGKQNIHLSSNTNWIDNKKKPVEKTICYEDSNILLQDNSKYVEAISQVNNISPIIAEPENMAHMKSNFDSKTPNTIPPAANNIENKDFYTKVPDIQYSDRIENANSKMNKVPFELFNNDNLEPVQTFECPTPSDVELINTPTYVMDDTKTIVEYYDGGQRILAKNDNNRPIDQENPITNNVNQYYTPDNFYKNICFATEAKEENKFNTTLENVQKCIVNTISKTPLLKEMLYNSKEAVDIPLQNLVITKVDNDKCNLVKTNEGIDLKSFLVKLKVLKAKLVLSSEESEIVNFIPIVNNNERRDEKVIQCIAKDIVRKAYKNPVILNEKFTKSDPYVLLKDINDSEALIWPAIYRNNDYYTT